MSEQPGTDSAAPGESANPRDPSSNEHAPSADEGLDGVARADPDGAEPQAAPPRRRWLLRLLVGVPISLLLALILVLLLVLGTQTGLRTAVGLAEDLLPGVISVEHVEGRVLGELHLRGLELHLSSLDLTLGELDLDWSPGSVFSGLLSIDRLAARDIDLVLAPGPTEKKPLTLADHQTAAAGRTWRGGG